MNKQSVILKSGKEHIFLSRHRWIFSGAIARYPENFEDGGIYPIYSHQKELLGYGYFHKKLSLAGRIISFGNKPAMQAIYDYLDEAIILRDKLFNLHQTNTFRLFNAEGDGISGLIIDQYADYLVVQSSTLGVDRLLKQIVEHLTKKGRWKGIFEKSNSSSRIEEALPNRIGLLFGEMMKEIEVKENGIHFLVDWQEGQKTGLFLDQREARKLAGELSVNKKVLNCFSYSGGFSLYALHGKARQIDSVDISAKALKMAEKNCKINAFSQENCRWIQADAFDFLSENVLDYELIILDPPAFIKSKKDISNGIKGYQQINSTVFSKAKAGSFLLTCSCSYYLSNEMFISMLRRSALQAKRDICILKQLSHAPDHLVSLFHSEGNYLKSALIYIN